MDKIAESFMVVSLFLLVLVIVGLFIGFPLMWLWNWLMPVIFGLPTITFWQAVGLYLLAGVLIKSTSSSKKD
jgi:hypothetical protein